VVSQKKTSQLELGPHLIKYRFCGIFAFMIKDIFKATPEGTLANIETQDGTCEVLVARRPDLIDPTRTLNRIVYIPGRELLNLISTDMGQLEANQKAMDTMGEDLLEDIKKECAQGAECGAEVAKFKERVEEISGAVTSVGIICSKACLDCPLNLRQEL
jgi:hypothetical protein